MSKLVLLMMALSILCTILIIHTLDSRGPYLQPVVDKATVKEAKKKSDDQELLDRANYLMYPCCQSKPWKEPK